MQSIIHIHKKLPVLQFRRLLSRVSILTCDIDIANLSVRLFVRLSVRPLRTGTIMKTA